MFDVTFLIPDYPDWRIPLFEPPCPEDVMPDRERERLNEELFARIDAGEFDPAVEILM